MTSSTGSRGLEMTDAKGRFVFTGVSPGPALSISASKPGYLTGNIGETAAGTRTSFALAPGQWMNTANITLLRLSSIAGVVSDERGNPVPGVYVRVLSEVFAAGLPHLATGAIAVTDDRGAYRIGGLKPGRFFIHIPSVQSTVSEGAVIPPGPEAAFGLSSQTPAPLFVSLEDGVRLAVGTYPMPPAISTGRLAYPAIFFPGAPTIAGATAIELGAGDDRTGIDMRLEPVPGVRVDGRLDGPPNVIGKQTVRLLPAGSEELGIGSETATALTTADGRFTLVNVPAGSYMLEAHEMVSEYTSRYDGSPSVTDTGPLPAPPGYPLAGFSIGGNPRIYSYASTTPGRLAGTPSYTARQSVTVRRVDLTSLVVPMRPGGEISGTIIWEGPEPVEWGVTSVSLEPARGDPTLSRDSVTAPFDTIETFQLANIRPGDYVVRVRNSKVPGLVKSVRWRGRDFADAPLAITPQANLAGMVITMTTDRPTLTGRVRGSRAAGTPNPSQAVLLFPAERDRWIGYGLTTTRFTSVSVETDGTYRVDSLPAGSYCVLALDARPPASWQNPDWLERAASLADRVTLDWGLRVTHDLAVVTVR
jgi:hypothetical protein